MWRNVVNFKHFKTNASLLWLLLQEISNNKQGCRIFCEALLDSTVIKLLCKYRNRVIFYNYNHKTDYYNDLKSLLITFCNIVTAEKVFVIHEMSEI